MTIEVRVQKVTLDANIWTYAERIHKFIGQSNRKLKSMTILKIKRHSCVCVCWSKAIADQTIHTRKQE